MYIIFMDDLGEHGDQVIYRVNEDGIQFNNGYAHFKDEEGLPQMVDIRNILEIGEE